MDQSDPDPITNPIADPIVEVVDSDAQSRTVVMNATAEGVATVVINRPHRKNAFDAEVIGALHEAFETLDAADGVRVVFVRGAAGTFSAGADLDWMRRASRPHRRPTTARTPWRWRTCSTASTPCPC